MYSIGGFLAIISDVDNNSSTHFFVIIVICGCVVQDVFDPELWRVIPYLLCISLIGIFILLQLRKRFIVDYALPYPSGTASGVLINSLHKIGDKTAGRQVGFPSPHLPFLHLPLAVLRGFCAALLSERVMTGL